jgi:hypothetical protein
MSTEYKFNKQKAVRKDDSGAIKSITPIFNSVGDPYSSVHKQAIELEKLAKMFPLSKVQVEINAIPESEYKMLKEDFDMKPGFQDGAGRFYYSPTVNSALICHKEI